MPLAIGIFLFSPRQGCIGCFRIRHPPLPLPQYDEEIAFLRFCQILPCSSVQTDAAAAAAILRS